MTEQAGQIAVYDPSMAAKVAAMFNDFNELWPGGFTEGIPYDEQRVHDWLDKTSAIADLIALDAQGEPVGYCGLYPHWRDKGACFVTILGVVPRVKGKKFGKRLLLRAVDLAREKGMQRLDLGTWPGNMNAVPLYKKIGLFWVPETSVYMQNYIPALTQIPLAKAWFDKHPDWYGCFQRELAQAPDKHIVDGMELYTYVFEAGEDRLVGEADRYGWGICGIERMLDGQTMAIKTRLRSHEILIGIPNAMTITIDNHTGEDLSVTLSAEPFKGMRWLETPFPLAMTVEDGETVRLSREFVVDETAETFGREASETIKSRIIFGGQVVDLVTGGKIRPAVALSCHNGYQVVPAGSETKVYLDLQNYAETALNGRVNVFVEGLPGSQQFEFALAAKEVSGIGIPITVPADLESPVLTVHARPSIEVDGTTAAMPTYRLPVVVDVRDLAVVVENNKGDGLHLLTDAVDVYVNLKGGNVNLGRRSLPGIGKRANFEAGPPFGMSQDGSIVYDYRVAREGKTLTLALCAASVQFPGLQIRKWIRVTPGVREIEHWVELVNLQAEGTHIVGGRLHTGGGGGISLNPFGEIARSFTPIDGKIVECDGQMPFMNENMVPQTPEHWPETWTAVQGLVDGNFAAWMWQPDRISKINVSQGMMSSLECETQQLQPGDAVRLFHTWYGFSYVSLTDVRYRWNQLVGHLAMPSNEQNYGLSTTPPIEVKLVDSNVVFSGETVRKQITLNFITPYPLPGELRLKLPAGWGGAFLTPDGVQGTVPLPEPVPGTPSVLDVELAVPAAADAAAALLQLCFNGEYDICFDLPLLLAAGPEVAVEKQTLEGQDVLAVSNGTLQFNVLAERGGNLIRLQDAQERSFLVDNFPEVVPMFFIDHHIGGIQSIVFGRNGDMPFVEPELVEAEIVQEGAWKGARASWVVDNIEALKGQQFSLCYLTLPGSPIVRVNLSHHNPTPRRIEWVGLLFVNLALQGELAGTIIQTPGGTQAWTRNYVPKPFLSLSSLKEPWGRVSKGDQSLSVLAVKGSRGTTMLADLQQLICGLLAGVPVTEPFGDTDIEFAVVINQPETQVEIIREALAQG
ncbi:MAG: GNAT family N-acetyltransferase [Anaerolineae bacterium]|nr:GNAT family N-acetyltransferase [Anaerolineae bacterium]